MRAMQSAHYTFEHLAKSTFAKQFSSFNLIGVDMWHHPELFIKIKARNVEDVRVVRMAR